MTDHIASATEQPDDGHGNALGTEYVLRCEGSMTYHDYVTAESYNALKAEIERLTAIADRQMNDAEQARLELAESRRSAAAVGEPPKPDFEDKTGYNAGRYDAIQKELIGPVEMERLNKTLPWVKSLVYDLVKRIYQHREAHRVPTSATEDTCKTCQGSGSGKAMTNHLGPDDYEVEVECPDCGGTGARRVSTAATGDAYFFVGYEDTPGFAVAWSTDEVRAALCEVIYGGSLTLADEETKEEIDAHMAWFEDDDQWSIDRSHWHVRYEIGGLECWRFPASLLRLPSAIRDTDAPLCDGCAQAWFTERNHLKGDHGCVVCAFLGNKGETNG